MSDWRARQNAVAKIENERLVPEGFEDSIDRGIERDAARKQHQRIEIPLHRTLRLDVLAGKIELHHPVEPNGIDGNRIEIIVQFGSSATWKPNDLCTGNSLANRRNDLRDRR